MVRLEAENGDLRSQVSLLEGDLKNLNTFLREHLEVCPLVKQGSCDDEQQGELAHMSAAQRLVNSPLPQDLIDDIFYG